MIKVPKINRKIKWHNLIRKTKKYDVKHKYINVQISSFYNVVFIGTARDTASYFIYKSALEWLRFFSLDF